jgi:hypothetical protein
MSDRSKKLKRKLMGDWPKGRELRGLLGVNAAEQIFDLVLGSGYIVPQIAIKTNTDRQVLNTIDIFLDLEIENCTRTMRHIHQAAGNKLSRGLLAPVIALHTMAPVAYGVQVGDTEAMKAARWVCNASQTTRGNLAEITLIERMIDMAIRMDTPMNFMSGLDTINKLLIAGGGQHAARGPVALPMPSPLPSSVGGRVLLEAAITFIQSRTPGQANCQWADLGCYLLGATIGCHGFPDANGRTGRVLYAICQVRGGGVFTGLTSVGEKLLHGL